jgi:chromosome partitioning protein
LIDEEARSRDLVLVDLEGTASRVVGHAVSRADLALVPLQASAMDASQARRAVELVREEEAVLGRAIPIRLVLTRTSPQIPTKAERAIADELRAAGVPMLRTHLHQRQAFGAIFSYRLALTELPEREVNGLPAALANATMLVGEITETIQALLTRKAA